MQTAGLPTTTQFDYGERLLWAKVPFAVRPGSAKNCQSYISEKDCFKLESSHSIDSRNGYSRPKAAMPAPEFFHLRFRRLPLAHTAFAEY